MSRKNESFHFRGGVVCYQFECECCGAQGSLDVERISNVQISCPDRCGAIYLQTIEKDSKDKAVLHLIIQPAAYGFPEGPVDGICQEDGCEEEWTTVCVMTDSDGSDDYEFFCSECAFKAGYCIGCGQFNSGIESFDFGNGFCDNCESELSHDDNDEWSDDWGDLDTIFP